MQTSRKLILEIVQSINANPRYFFELPYQVHNYGPKGETVNALRETFKVVIVIPEESKRQNFIIIKRLSLNVITSLKIVKRLNSLVPLLSFWIFTWIKVNLMSRSI